MSEAPRHIENLQAEVANLNKEVTKLTAVMKVVNENISGMVRQHDAEIYGKGDAPGLRTRTSKLEQSSEGRTWRERIYFSSILGLIGKAFYDVWPR